MMLRVVILLSCVFLVSIVQANEHILRLGVFPYYSPEKLSQIHNPLVGYLHSVWPEPVHFTSAPDFKQFRQRTASGKFYDLIITAPHLGVLAEREAGYQRVVMTNNRSHAVFVTLTQSGLRTLDDLCGKRLVLPPQRAIISHLALKALPEQNDGCKIETRNTKSHNNALSQVLHKQVDAAAIGLPTWNSISPEQRTQLHVLGVSDSIPGFFIMAHKNISSAQITDLRQCLFEFEQTSVGHAYLQSSALQGFTLIDDASVEGLEPYIKAIFQ